MVHNAFDEECVVSDSPVKIDCAIYCEEDSGVYVACSDGGLRIYKESSDEERRKFVLRQTIVGFAKKAVLQMDLVKSRGGMLISLAETLSVHTIPGFEPVAFLHKTKGANLFCWDEQRGLLCVAKQKRLHIYRYDGSREFTEIKELSVPDVVKSMVWSGDAVYMGVKREYMFMNVITGALTDIFSCGQHASPLVVSLPGGKIMLCKDKVGVFVEESGNVTWTEPPLDVMVHPPYIIGRSKRDIEVRWMREPYGSVQRLPHKDSRLVQSGSFGLLTVSGTAVYMLIPVTIGVQVVQLAASGNFDDALALCKLMPPEDGAVRKSKEDAIHTRYGEFLFGRGQYAEALQHFALSSLSLASIVALFPSIKLPKFCAESDLKGLEDIGEADASEQEKPGPHALSVLATFLMNRRGDVVDRAEAQETDDAVAALVARKSHKGDASSEKKSDDPRNVACVLDTALVQALLQTDQSSMAVQLLKGSNYCDMETCEEMMMSAGHFKELVELYRYNKMHRKALELLFRLVESPETFPVPPAEGEFSPESIAEYLQTLEERDSDLVLDFTTSLLKLSPDHAMRLFTSTDPPLPTETVLLKLKNHAELRIVYLEEMVKHSPDAFSADIQKELLLLYLEDAKSDEPKTTNKFLEHLQKFTAYDPREVFRRLPQDDMLEEKAVLYGKMGAHKYALYIYVHELHDPAKALSYCESVSKNGEATGLNSLSKDQNVYSILLEMYLKPSSSFRELKLSLHSVGLKRKPKPEKARAKGHVARKVTQIEEAQSFTDGNESTAESSSRSDMEESGDSKTGAKEVMLDEAIHLLKSKWDCFNAAEVLQMLPPDAKLEELLPFLEPLLRKSTEKCRNSAVISKVQYSSYLDAQYERQLCRQRRFKLTSETQCSICHKRIGPSVVAVYPNGGLAHFVCYSEQNGNRGLGS